MTFLPIIARELRVSSRKARTYWGRMGIAAAMLVMAGWVLVMFHRQPPAQQAIALFGTLTGAMMFVGGFAGMAATADSLSSEKRDGTLGLLFLTPLRGYDVVLGKLVTGSLTVLYGLLSVLPLMALPVLLGGVSGGQFVRMSLLLLNTMLLSLAVGIGVSSVGRDEKRARGLALLIMVLLAGGFPVAGAWLEHEMKADLAANCLYLFSPGYAFGQAWRTAPASPLTGYWMSMAVIHGTAWLFVILACWFAPRTWQDRPTRKRWLGMGPFRVAEGDTASGAAPFRARLLDRNAFFWLTARPRFRPLWPWMSLLLVTVLWVGFGLKYPRDLFHEAMFVVMALTWNGILKAWVASEATRQIASDRKAGAIELLLSTPLSVREIVQGVWLSLNRQFGAALLVVLLVECLLLVVGAREIGRGDDRVVWVAVWICGMSMLVADLLALYAVGLWQSAVAKGPAEAAGAAAFRILALPWLLYMFLGAVVALADGLGVIRGVPDPEWVFWLGSWTLIGFGVDLLFGMRAWRAVHSRFRLAAAQRVGGRGLGYALGRLFGRMTARRGSRP